MENQKELQVLKLQKVGFVGLGLIGGSIARAIHQYYPDCQIIACDQDKDMLAQATSEGIIQVACSSIDDNFRHCDFVFLCMPVSYNNEALKKMKALVDEHTIITDVGSVKTSIHREAAKLGMEGSFIGGHPMTGSEKSGFSNSKALLLENAYYVITPTSQTSDEKIDRYVALTTSLKGLPIVLDYREHDQITGTISHLPHIIASSLVNFVRESDNSEGLMKLLAAGGFKDITRIASSSPTMWEHICMNNRENISPILAHYIELLETAKSRIDTGDGPSIHQMFEQSRNYRDSISENGAGPIQKVYRIYCDLIDEAGGIATIATILASNNISIKNIGIVHNREFEEGVLRIEFYDAEAAEKAAELLRRYRYVIYE